MTGPKVSDRAVLRFLERQSGVDVNELRDALSASLERAYRAARSMGDSDFLIRMDGAIYVVRGDVIATVIEDKGPIGIARALEHEQS